MQACDENRIQKFNLKTWSEEKAYAQTGGHTHTQTHTHTHTLYIHITGRRFIIYCVWYIFTQNAVSLRVRCPRNIFLCNRLSIGILHGSFPLVSLKWIFKRWNMIMQTGFIRLRTGFSEWLSLINTVGFLATWAIVNCPRRTVLQWFIDDRSCYFVTLEAASVCRFLIQWAWSGVPKAHRTLHEHNIPCRPLGHQ